MFVRTVSFSATQHVTPPAAVPVRGNADDGRVGKDGQPLLPSITGGTLCSSNGPLPVQNPQSEVLLVKNKPTTKHHETKETRNQELIDEPTHAHTQTFVTASRNWRPRTQPHDERSWVPGYIQLTISTTLAASRKLPNSRHRGARPRHRPPEYRLVDQAPKVRLSPSRDPAPNQRGKAATCGGSRVARV